MELALSGDKHKLVNDIINRELLQTCQELLADIAII